MTSPPDLLREKIALDKPADGATDAYGNPTGSWSEVLRCRAEFSYKRGSEAVEAARLEGRAIYRVRIRTSHTARAVTADWRMRDLRRGTVYNVREADSITDPEWIWLVVESGVAV